MAVVEIARIDSRLIHGQVITKWTRQIITDEIVIIDDLLADDQFMLSIYKMAAPSDMPVRVFKVDDAVNAFNKSTKKWFILFKDVQTAYRSIQAGLPLKKLQIGGLGSGPDKKKIYGPIYFDEADVKMLSELDDNGIEVLLHQVPEEASMSFEKALEKY